MTFRFRTLRILKGLLIINLELKKEMTKTSVFGQNERIPHPKKIEFIQCLNYQGQLVLTETRLIDFDNIILLKSKKATGRGVDIMYAYDDKDPNAGAVYIGNWNDGIV